MSLEVSPRLADDTAGTVAAAKDLHARAGRPNLFIKIPGTPAGVPAIEEAIFAGVPVNVTLLFSRNQYLAAMAAYMRGIERRVAKGLSADIASVASIFVSRWDVAVKDKVPPKLANKLGIAVAMQCYSAYRDMLASPRWQNSRPRVRASNVLLWLEHRHQRPRRCRYALRRKPAGRARYRRHHPRRGRYWRSPITARWVRRYSTTVRPPTIP